MNSRWLIGIVAVIVLVLIFGVSGVSFSPRPQITAKNSTNATLLPDLTILSLNVNVSQFQNNSGNASYWQAVVKGQIKNIGQVSTPVSRTKFVVTGFGARYVYTPAIAPGQEVFVTDTYTNLQHGLGYNINATADGRFEIRESNENNNDKSTTFQA